MAGNVNVTFNIKKLPEKPWFWGVVLFIGLLIFVKVATAFASLFLIFLFILIYYTLNAYGNNSDSRHGFLAVTLVCLFLVVACGVFVPREWRGKTPEIKPVPTQTSPAIRTNSPFVIKPNIIKLGISIKPPLHVR